MTLENQNDSWSVCQPGTLNRFSEQIRRQEARRRQTRVAMGVAGVVVGCCAVLLLQFNTRAISEPNQGSGVEAPGQGAVSISAHLSCPEVVERCDHYLLGMIDGELHQRIRTHLGHCASCEEFYRARSNELQVEYSVLVLPPAERSFALFVAR